MKKLIFTSCFVVSIFLFTSKPATAQSFNPQLAAMLQDTLNTYLGFISNIKGMSASVYLPGQGTWQGTGGVSYSGQPITKDMEFGIASNTKVFVAAAMLKLAENNILSLDDSLHTWLPSYPNINPNITIRQLLNHTSGVQDPIFLVPWMDTIMNNPTRVFTPQEVLGWVGAPLFAPGTSWSYSNVNYILAGMIAESATGYHISQIIRDSILTPLNLDSTFYDVYEPEIGTLAHRWYNGIDFNDTSRVGLNTSAGCAGALFSNSGDMSRWYRALMTGQLLSPASFAQLTTFVPTGGAYTYGLGLENQTYFGHNTYQHGGSTWGYKSRMIYDPCSGAVVCGLVNSWPAGMDGLTLLLFRVVVNHIPGCVSPISGAVSVCPGTNNVTYTVPAIANATSYIWTLPNGATGTSATNSITVNFGASAVSGDITVRGNNLYGVGAEGSLHVTVNPVYTFTENHTICNGESYNWHNIEYFATGTYFSNYTTINGCDSTYTLNLSVNAVNTGVTLNGNTLSVDIAADAYQWLDCNNTFQSIATATGQSFSPLANGSYAAAITGNGCVDTSACLDITTVGINEIQTNGITLYPNPASGIISLEIPSRFLPLQQSSIEIYDAFGNKVLQSLIQNSKSKINIESFRNGIYLIRVINNSSNTIYSQTIFKQ